MKFEALFQVDQKLKKDQSLATEAERERTSQGNERRIETTRLDERDRTHLAFL